MRHNYTKGSMIALAISFMLLPLIFVCLRIWAKSITKRFAWDDYLAIGALVSRQGLGPRSTTLTGDSWYR